MTVNIDLWVWELEELTPAKSQTTLSVEEQARAASFVRREDGNRFASGRARMRAILANYAGTHAASLAFDIAGRKKPVLPGGPAFNLSHSGNVAVMAVTPDHEEASVQLGVDIEAHRAVEPRIAEISFSRAEQRALVPLTGPNWTDAFFRCWTRKEAVIKALGQGLYLDLGSFDVTLTDDQPAKLLRMAPGNPAPDQWQMVSFQLGASLPGALACISGGHPLNTTVRDAPDSLDPVFCF